MVTRAGQVSFNVHIENPPWRAGNSSFALEFDLDSDKDDGTLERNTTTREVDTTPESVRYADESEDRVTFDGTRRIRWRRRVFCKTEDDRDIEVTVRSRIVASTETAEAGFSFRKKLIVTFHHDTDRCHRLFWDPSGDIGSDDVILPSETVSGSATSGATSGASSGATSAATSGASSGATSAATSGATSAATSGASSDSSGAVHLTMGLFITLLCLLLF